MQSGLSIVELYNKIEESEKNHRDFLAHSSQFKTTTKQNGHKIRLEIPEQKGKEDFFGGIYEIGTVAHEQLSDRLGIPKRYYDRMLAEDPSLLAVNVNTWLDKYPEKRLLRTLGPRLRAFLSDIYLPLDNWLVAQAALPILADQSEFKIVSAQITERRLYVQAITPKIAGEIRPGQKCQAGVVLSNSEVGLGSFRVEALFYFPICKNGMIGAHTLRRHHVGRRLKGADLEVLTPETRRAENAAFMLAVRDMVKAAFDEVQFAKSLEKIRLATEREIPPDKIREVVSYIGARFLSVGEREDVLGRLVKSGDLTQYGLCQAVTNLANDIAEYERAIELERIGGQIIDLSPKQWAASAYYKEPKNGNKRETKGDRKSDRED